MANAVTPRMKSGGNGTATTLAAGSSYVPLTTQACSQVTIVNNTGTTIGVRQDGSGAELPVFDQTYFTFFGLGGAEQLAIRRVDVGATPVTVAYRWEV